MLSLGLITAFSTSVFAVDVKFSGSYYAGGMYLDKTTLVKDAGNSTAFYFQRLRVQTDFIVSPGLTLTTRFDAMERAWGAARTAPGTGLDTQSAGTIAENENIAFDYAYVTYNSPIGIFKVGYQPGATWGTIFGNGETPQTKISHSIAFGNFSFTTQLLKVIEKSTTVKNPAGYADADKDQIYLMPMYTWSAGRAGLFYSYSNDTSTRPGVDGYKTRQHQLMPFVEAKLGPVALQAELIYITGKQRYDGAGADIDIDNLGGWVDATATFNPIYFGATFAYVSGDDPGTAGKKEGGSVTGGNDWNPCLILWNYDRAYWAGALDGNSTSMTNAFFYQGRAGVKPIDKLDIMASVSYAYADEKPIGYQNDEYGWEVDLVGTYKITNNLSYMLGFGYLFTGDYYKGATNVNVQDDFTVINKLTLTF